MTATFSKQWPLQIFFPKLLRILNPIELCELPTPVEALPGLGNNAWVKRDDLSNQLYGGNKTRKFEFIAADILKKKATHVVTLGGTGTNHGVATAMVCTELGLDCTVITFNQPDSPFVKKNQALMKKFGAKLINAGSLTMAAMRFYLDPLRLSQNHYFLAGGGGTALGTLAYVNAALELHQQIANGDCPEPDSIYVPAGSVATLAGLTLGCAIAGIKTKVIGIQIMDSHLGPVEICTASVGNRLMQQALKIIQVQQPELTINLPSVILLNDWYPPGYGVHTLSTDNAMALGACNGLQLDQTYSGKTFDAFTQALSQTTKPLLYWATYSSAQANYKVG
jgi:1-aminocyclopropane-1-carboxylate deaminase/D-cysteine desulfhydrase-like pyridoxal-dependent ACC family enzyme